MKPKILYFLFVLLVTSNVVLAKQTHITVRVLGKDSKFIGSSMGGVLVSIIDIESGKTLVSGKTKGNTGDTKIIMKTPHHRYSKLTTPTTASFNATLDLKKPVRVKIHAKGPLNIKNQQEISVTTWVFPGKHMNKGNGIILTLPGFALSPYPLSKKAKVNEPLELRVSIKMMCGCPIEPNGLWDSEKMEFWAVVKRNKEQILKKPLEFHETSIFKLSFTPEQKGSYEVTFMAYDEHSYNTGLTRISFAVE